MNAWTTLGLPFEGAVAGTVRRLLVGVAPQHGREHRLARRNSATLLTKLERRHSQNRYIGICADLTFLLAVAERPYLPRPVRIQRHCVAFSAIWAASEQVIHPKR